MPDESEAVHAFPAAVSSAAQARHFVADFLAARAEEAVAASAAIVIAELAANAVLHARSDFTVAVSCRPGVVRISVRDSVRLDTCWPMISIPGHGLDVVAKVAARWAAEPLPDGKVIWAEVQ